MVFFLVLILLVIFDTCVTVYLVARHRQFLHEIAEMQMQHTNKPQQLKPSDVADIVSLMNSVGGDTFDAQGIMDAQDVLKGN